MNVDELKKQAAEYAVSFIKSGMVVGLGTGSTTLYALKKIAQLLETGELKNIVGIPSSVQTEIESKKLNIPLTTLDEHPVIDITIDGADEAAVGCPERSEGSKKFYLIKGGGGALLREKILAQASKEEIIIIDESKYSEVIGTKWCVPVEVIPFALNAEKLFLQSINAEVELRLNKEGNILITDEGNYILDADFGTIKSPEELANKLNNRAGIVEHGLFIGLASRVIIAGVRGINEL